MSEDADWVAVDPRRKDADGPAFLPYLREIGDPRLRFGLWCANIESAFELNEFQVVRTVGYDTLRIP